MALVKINGTDLFYVENGCGVPCLVMHGGLGVDHTQFREWLDPLGDALRLIYYDHRGHYPFAEEGPAFQAAVRKWLQAVSGSSARGSARSW